MSGGMGDDMGDDMGDGGRTGPGAGSGSGRAAAGSPRLSLVLAVQGGQENLDEILAALPPRPGAVEILLCHAADDPLPPGLTGRTDLRIVTGAADALIPELWRDGIRAARGAWLATLTAHCPPAPDWLDRALDLTGAAPADRAAIGGPVLMPAGADRVARAVHLLRYAGAAPPPAPRPVTDLSADNALYRRGPVLDCADLLEEGFWEPAFHRRFLARGLNLELRPDLAVLHRNRYSARGFLRQRRRHGRVFGRHRAAAARPAARVAMLLAAPAAFPVFALKQTRRILARPALRADLPGAAGWLYLFMAGWCWGEAQGYADAVFAPRRRAARPEGAAG
jgi:hypothetical protein